MAAHEAAARSGSRNIAVAIRVRPLSRLELQAPQPASLVGDVGSLAWAVDSVEPNCINDLVNRDRWNFSHVFGPNVSTSHIFRSCVQEVVESCAEGINGSILAYGQTASGKTYTMHGDGLRCGLIPESLWELFRLVDSFDRQFSVTISYLEIYNEQVVDLLGAEGGAEVKLRDGHDGQLRLTPLTAKAVESPSEALDCLAEGDARRKRGETRVNERSSRSHTILRVSVKSWVPDEASVRQSQLNLVDLAGSEGERHTGVSGERRREGSNINKSLLALSQVINALADDSRRSHISFRDSKLTRILQSSLGGNAHTVVVCAASPASQNYFETKSTLEFASRAMKVQNKVNVNFCIDDESMVRKLEQEIDVLRCKLKQGCTSCTSQAGRTACTSAAAAAAAEMHEELWNEVCHQTAEEVLRLRAMLASEEQRYLNAMDELAALDAAETEKESTAEADAETSATSDIEESEEMERQQEDERGAKSPMDTEADEQLRVAARLPRKAGKQPEEYGADEAAMPKEVEKVEDSLEVGNQSQLDAEGEGGGGEASMPSTSGEEDSEEEEVKRLQEELQEHDAELEVLRLQANLQQLQAIYVRVEPVRPDPNSEAECRRGLRCKLRHVREMLRSELSAIAEAEASRARAEFHVWELCREEEAKTLFRSSKYPLADVSNVLPCGNAQ
eukprot:TRINITY_DN6978_c0_g1_i5.p1 TRINITY_DN6978_c0_g1~~TRINITY_DN6978_c0_g1_i5.p1  ORF type:complete len:676 (-),score=166.96 TRINITY_DN6978_c0_g1_i5:34-2061(-)